MQAAGPVQRPQRAGQLTGRRGDAREVVERRHGFRAAVAGASGAVAGDQLRLGAVDLAVGGWPRSRRVVVGAARS